MIRLNNDYNEIACSEVMAALQETNMEHTDGYGDDKFSHACADMIREMIGRPDAHIHFMVGGTPTNTRASTAAPCWRSTPGDPASAIRWATKSIPSTSWSRW